MSTVVASAPGKIILFGEHGVHRQQPNITTAVNLRTTCRVATRADDRYSFRSGAHCEAGSREQLAAFKAHVDGLREAGALSEIATLTKDFFVPARYVMATFVDRQEGPGLDVEWRSALPIGSGLGSGAAASTAMVQATAAACRATLSPEDVIFMAWQGDVIAHGGYGSSLDSSTCTYGGTISYTMAEKARRLLCIAALPLVIGDTLVEHSTAKINTRIRLWLEESPARLHIFRDMGYLIQQFMPALERADLVTLGHLLSIHQLLQEKMGTSCPESDRLIEASLEAGALGAKISGSGGGGIIIALTQPGQEQAVAAAIDAAGGRSYVASTGAQGVRLESQDAWEAAGVQ
jgi:mevalonate kinase